MLDEYCEEQGLACNIFFSEIKSGHLSHAYLIDENNYSRAFELIISFVVEIISIGVSEEEKKILAKRVHENNYPEFKIIEPEGMLIKKQQILDLQHDFALEAVEGNKRIYVIRDADKMRSETANSMLKFLEEPSNNIIAILMTNNYNGILPTIVSRCQIIKLANDNKNVQSDYLEMAVNFVKNVENNGIKVILDIQNILFQYISSKERDKLILFFDIVIDVYYDIMKIVINSQKLKYLDYYDVLRAIALKNSKESIIKKINYLVMAKDSIRYNVNNNLLVDSVIVNLGGMYEGSWS